MRTGGIREEESQSAVITQTQRKQDENASLIKGTKPRGLHRKELWTDLRCKNQLIRSLSQKANQFMINVDLRVFLWTTWLWDLVGQKPRSTNFKNFSGKYTT